MGERSYVAGECAAKVAVRAGDGGKWTTRVDGVEGVRLRMGFGDMACLVRSKRWFL